MRDAAAEAGLLRTRFALPNGSTPRGVALRIIEMALAIAAGSAALVALQEDWLALGVLLPEIDGSDRTYLPLSGRIIWAALDHRELLTLLSAALVTAMLAAAVRHTFQLGRFWLAAVLATAAAVALPIMVLSWALRNHTDQTFGAFTPLRSGGLACTLVVLLTFTAWGHQVSDVAPRGARDRAHIGEAASRWRAAATYIAVGIVSILAIVAMERFWLAAGTHVVERSMSSGGPIQPWERAAYDALMDFHVIDWILSALLVSYSCAAMLGALGNGRTSGLVTGLAGFLPVIGCVYYLESVSTRLMPTLPHWLVIAAGMIALAAGAGGLTSIFSGHSRQSAR